MKRDEVIERLRRSEAAFKKAGVEHLYLFGSTARDEARSDSDIDLFFDFARDDFGMFDLIDLREMTADILGATTDLIPRDGLHHILREGIEASALQVF